jgi:peptidoglycan/LPS O-acetylase OafA/YrhL
MDTSALRILAVFLIANSHLEGFYPVGQLAGDDLIGNSLFFMLSGFGLSLSASMRAGRFTEWYAKRLSRVYAPLWLTIVVATLLAAVDWRIGTLDGFFQAFLWPTPYGFLAQIILFYPIFYFVKSAKHPAVMTTVVIGMISAYLTVSAVYYNLHALSWLFYFAMMLFGGFLAGRCDKPGAVRSIDLGVLALSLLVYLGLKVAMTTGRFPNHVAILHLLVFPIVYGLMRVFAASRVRDWCRSSRLAPAIGLVAGLTLEIYLVHEFVTHDRRISSLAFPVNVLAFWIVTLPMAWSLGMAADAARRLVGARRAPANPSSLAGLSAGRGGSVSARR